jgi:hypothetical protein
MVQFGWSCVVPVEMAGFARAFARDIVAAPARGASGRLHHKAAFFLVKICIICFIMFLQVLLHDKMP